MTWKWNEQYGLAYLEAMSSGLPVVTTRCGTNHEAVRGENLLVDDDAEALAAGLLTYLHDQERRRRVGAANRSLRTGGERADSAVPPDGRGIRCRRDTVIVRGGRSVSLAVVGAATGLVAGVVALGPVLLHRGFTLSYDMVFVPGMPRHGHAPGAWTARCPGRSPATCSSPSSVTPSPADLLQKALLLGAVRRWPGAGAARLPAAFPRRSRRAPSLYVWNPWVLERLVIGHWTFLLGLAVLPWAVHAAARLRDGAPRRCVVDGAAGCVAAGTVRLDLAGCSSPQPRPWSPAGPAPRPGTLRPCGGCWTVVATGCRRAPWSGCLPSLLRPGGIPATPRASRPSPPGRTLRSARGGACSPWAGSGTRRPGRGSAQPGAARRVRARRGGRALVLALPRLVRTADSGGPRAGGCGRGGVPAGRSPGPRPDCARGCAGWCWRCPGGGLLRDGQKLLTPRVLVRRRLLRDRGGADRGGRRASLAVAVLLVGLVVPACCPGWRGGCTGGWGRWPTRRSGRRCSGRSPTLAGAGRRGLVPLHLLPAVRLERRPRGPRPDAPAARPRRRRQRRPPAVDRDRPRRGPARGCRRRRRSTGAPARPVLPAQGVRLRGRDAVRPGRRRATGAALAGGRVLARRSRAARLVDVGPGGRQPPGRYARARQPPDGSSLAPHGRRSGGVADRRSRRSRLLPSDHSDVTARSDTRDRRWHSGDLGHDGDAGFVIPLLLAVIIGAFLAGLASFALVQRGQRQQRLARSPHRSSPTTRAESSSSGSHPRRARAGRLRRAPRHAPSPCSSQLNATAWSSRPQPERRSQRGVVEQQADGVDELARRRRPAGRSTPSTTDSAVPPAVRKATVGVPWTPASTTASPQPSLTDGSSETHDCGEQPVLGGLVDEPDEVAPRRRRRAAARVGPKLRLPVAVADHRRARRPGELGR